jgi:hypothetical protein
MARRERIVPTKLSWRSVTEAMATPPSNTRSESFIFWLQEVENINLPLRNLEKNHLKIMQAVCLCV